VGDFMHTTSPSHRPKGWAFFVLIRRNPMSVAVSTLYMDESGARQPDLALSPLPDHGRDWFGIGGVMINDEDEHPVKNGNIP
jgi:hypothetical protein